ncbi:hypothetical protein D3C75_754580 [compost metagenome]
MATPSWRWRYWPPVRWTITTSVTASSTPSTCCISLRWTKPTPAASIAACRPRGAMPTRYADASPPTCGRTSTPRGWRCATSPAMAWRVMASATSVSGLRSARTCSAVQRRAPSCATMPTLLFAWGRSLSAPITPCACSMRAMKCSAKSRRRSVITRRVATTSGVPCCGPCHPSKPSTRSTAMRRGPSKSPRCCCCAPPSRVLCMLASRSWTKSSPACRAVTGERPSVWPLN